MSSSYIQEQHREGELRDDASVFEILKLQLFFLLLHLLKTPKSRYVTYKIFLTLLYIKQRNEKGKTLFKVFLKSLNCSS